MSIVTTFIDRTAEEIRKGKFHHPRFKNAKNHIEPGENKFAIVGSPSPASGSSAVRKDHF